MLRARIAEKVLCRPAISFLTQPHLLLGSGADASAKKAPIGWPLIGA